MASARALSRASLAVGIAAAAFALAALWQAVWLVPPAPPAPAPQVASAPPPSALPPSGAELELTAARSAYLAAVMRAPGPGESSREVAEARRRAFEAEAARLAALGPGAAPLLAARLAAERNDHARLLLLTALARIPGETGVRGALAALETLQDSALEPLFLDRLVRADDPASLRLLEAVLRESPRAETRAAVLVSAARHRDRRLASALPQLALHDPSGAVRMQALATADEVGVPLDSAVLEQLAHADAEPALRARALGTLATKDPHAFLRYARRTLTASQPDAGQALLVTRALARSAEPEAAALLDELAGARDPAVAEAAARARRARSASGLSR
jgi:hypothetical protein